LHQRRFRLQAPSSWQGLENQAWWRSNAQHKNLTHTCVIEHPIDVSFALMLCF
jgi:hypothetical protein